MQHEECVITIGAHACMKQNKEQLISHDFFRRVFNKDSRAHRHYL